MIFVDAHVHIYDCFDLDVLFDSAVANFQTAAKHCGITNKPFSSMLLLTERASDNWFQHVFMKIKPGKDVNNPDKRWVITHTGDELSLRACHNDCPEEEIYLIAGRQIVTAEKIEVLALFCNTGINDGLSLNETVSAIRQCNGIAVIPWGVGKWIGKRGKILQDFLPGYGGKEIFLGDNGGRPWCWPTPTLFHLARKKGISVLPGTDPLPLPHEAMRVGSFGFFLDHHPLNINSPATSVRDLLISNKETLYPFGRLQNIKSFFTNQLQLRFNS
ncbi:MAG: hypothetical protein Q8R42_02365 [Desulfocapsaceae bacterium]|nr:hypothetical protein [Desulfocapsaceae bacterium]